MQQGILRLKTLSRALLSRSYASTTGQASKILINHQNSAVIGVTLNSPKSLNSLDLDMIDILHDQCELWNADKNLEVVYFKGAGPKAFCAGGDIMKLYKARANHKEGKPRPEILDRFFRNEFELDYALATMRPTQVALWNGVVMGGGVGISIHAPVKVATENTVFAMPEAKIGFFTDVGGGYFLSKLDRKVGYYLGLTSDTLKGKDLVRAGVATHYMTTENLEKFEQDLVAGIQKGSSGEQLNKLLDQYSEDVKGELQNIELIER